MAHNVYKLCNISRGKPGRMNERPDLNGLSINKCNTKSTMYDVGSSYLGIDQECYKN